MHLLLIANDLMVISRVDGAVKNAGATMNVAGSVQRALELRDEIPLPGLIILDLALPGLDIPALISGIKAEAGGVPFIVAFGPHVHAERLAAAEAAGCDAVMPRGQFFAQVDALVATAIG